MGRVDAQNLAAVQKIHVHGLVEARVGGHRDDHARTTLGPAAASCSATSTSSPVSVTTASTSDSSPNRARQSLPTLVWSASTTTFRAACSMARLTAASPVSGVVSPLC